ncbi:hypothetical protein INT47_009922 [Mucor saturninus]|uniref:Uncharacterized protein n=1 Tax=Mucor saturninus TaxID=64648 RepID=A0A8H7UPS2_9FUNG|nr:hypothetical protein INT47_009922 [Mucor saturninus]
MDYKDEKLPPSNYAVLRWFGFDQFVPETAVTSHWVSPKVFLAIRSLLALYSTIVIWTDIGFDAYHGKFTGFFAFFTNLTFIGLHAYLITSTVHHIRYLRNKNVDSFLKQPAFLNYLYVYLYCTVITNNIVTPVVFWGILARYLGPISTMQSWLNASVHGASFFLMIFDVIFNRMKVPIRMILFVFFTVVLYMFLTFIVHASAGYWVYPFLDWKQGPITAAYYFAVAVIVVLAFFIQVLIHYVRDLIARKTARSHQNTVSDSQDMTKLETNHSNVV